LIALDASPASYLWQVANALGSGTPAELPGVLKAIAPQVGGPEDRRRRAGTHGLPSAFPCPMSGKLGPEQNQRIADLEQQQYQQQPPPPPQQAAPAQGPFVIDQLNQLNDLRQRGALTDEEFAAAKAKVLGS